MTDNNLRKVAYLYLNIGKFDRPYATIKSGFEFLRFNSSSNGQNKKEQYS